MDLYSQVLGNKNTSLANPEQPKTIYLTGSDLRIEEIDDLVSDQAVQAEISDLAKEEVRKSYDFLHQELGEKIIYGVNTGFGPMASFTLPKDQLRTLQENLIRSHAVGIGEPIAEEYVLAAMLVRLNTLVKGYSGVSLELVELLKTFINKRIVPVVPEHGAVGTSGDLIQLAHIGLALIGEGEVFFEGKRRKTGELLAELRIKPHVLQAKEGLAIINGTSVMAGIAALLCIRARRLLSVAVRNGAWALELVRAQGDSIDEILHSLRPHAGQMEIAKLLRELLKSSTRLRNRELYKTLINHSESVREIFETVQEVYSFRCLPQILGPILDVLKKVQREMAVEINAVADNPVVDRERGLFLHGGNFHGDQIATAVDQLKIGIVKLTMLTERRINFFLNKNVNKKFPAFLNLKEPGLSLALQGLQFVATSTTAQSQSLAFPHSLHSIPTNADNQDVVSMGTDAALIAAKVLENAFVVLAIELVALAQATDCVPAQNGYSDGSKKLYDAVRRVCPKVVEDRAMSDELEGVVDFLKTNLELDLIWI